MEIPAFEKLAAHVDEDGIAWCNLRESAEPYFSPDVLDELNTWANAVRFGASANNIQYHVLGSQIPGVFNLGGDLALFSKLSQDGDRNGLLEYGKSCIDSLYANITRFNRSITTISLVQGTALGGGFEAALSSDIIIAEKGTQMGFPEILFNLFPGMGAFSLLSRKLDAQRAERLILGGGRYSAEELYDMGLVDVLAQKGDGIGAVRDYIKREKIIRGGALPLRKIRQMLYPISYKELYEIVKIWVDTALQLTERDIKKMQLFARRQKRLLS